MGRDFKQAATHEIDTFKDEYRRRNPGADVDKLTDEDLLREVMNTVGKQGRLGEHVRCVVSVSMLTEGWDANTVTHILGIRRFGSQLLCEQVVGRGLRRRSYAPNDEGRFDPEYAEVYGVPFAFIPGKPTKEAPPRPPAVEVRALDDRAELRITFPKVDGYRLEIPDEQFFTSFDDTTSLHLERSTVATWTESAGIVGVTEEQILDRYRNARVQEVAYQVARTLLRRELSVHDGVVRPWLFPQVVGIAREWLDTCVTVDPDTTIGMLLLSEGTHLAAERLFNALIHQPGSRHPRLLPILRPFDPDGSTDDVNFFTRKVVIDATKSHVNRVVLDGPGGNTWEQILSLLCEQHEAVAAYVKNDHLGFTIPYVHEGRSYQYVPDFLLRFARAAGRRAAHPRRRSIRRAEEGSLTRQREGQGRYGSEPMVRCGEQPRRFRPLGLRRDHRHEHRGGETRHRDREPLRRRHRHRLARRRGSRSLMPSRKKKPAGPTPVEAIVHTDKRTNLPTADAQEFVTPEVEAIPKLRTRVTRRSIRSSCGRAKTSKTRIDLEVDAPPIYIQEKIDPRVLIENLRTTAKAGEPEPEMTLFETFDGLGELDLVDYYKHDANWSNRMILGDSLQVMASLAERESLRGKVQMIYIDPPYGIKFGSNWQVSTRKRDVKDGKIEDTSREVEIIRGIPRHVGTRNPLILELPPRSSRSS